MEPTLDKISGQLADLSKQVGDRGSQVTDLSKHVSYQAGQLADISKQLSGFETQLATAMTDLKDHARINVDEVKQEVRLLGDSYVATLEGIERKLSDLNEKVDTKFGDHDLVLPYHNKRITKLERR